MPYENQQSAFNQVVNEFANGNAAVDLFFKTVPNVANGEPQTRTASEHPIKPILDGFFSKNSLNAAETKYQRMMLLIIE